MYKLGYIRSVAHYQLCDVQKTNSQGSCWRSWTPETATTFTVSNFNLGPLHWNSNSTDIWQFNELIYLCGSSKYCLSLSCRVLQNGQTYFKNLARWTPQRVNLQTETVQERRYGEFVNFLRKTIFQNTWQLLLRNIYILRL